MKENKVWARQLMAVSNHKSCQSHCCITHGCKYCYDDCPVVNGMVTQDYPCEDCGEHIKTVDDVIFEKNASSMEIKSTDNKFWSDLIDFLNSYPTTKPKETVIRVF